MSTNLVTVELDDKLALVKEVFEHSKFHHLLALEDSELLGVVSDRNLFKAPTLAARPKPSAIVQP